MKARFRYVRTAMLSCQYSSASGCCLVLSPRGRCCIDAVLSTHIHRAARGAEKARFRYVRNAAHHASDTDHVSIRPRVGAV